MDATSGSSRAAQDGRTVSAETAVPTPHSTPSDVETELALDMVKHAVPVRAGRRLLSLADLAARDGAWSALLAVAVVVVNLLLVGDLARLGRPHLADTC